MLLQLGNGRDLQTAVREGAGATAIFNYQQQQPTPAQGDDNANTLVYATESSGNTYFNTFIKFSCITDPIMPR